MAFSDCSVSRPLAFVDGPPPGWPICWLLLRSPRTGLVAGQGPRCCRRRQRALWRRREAGSLRARPPAPTDLLQGGRGSVKGARRC